jgi:hypothetical protein
MFGGSALSIIEGERRCRSFRYNRVVDKKIIMGKMEG